MKKITLTLDAETIAKLEEIGENGRGSALSNEILGMALQDAYFDAKKKKRATRKKN